MTGLAGSHNQIAESHFARQFAVRSLHHSLLSVSSERGRSERIMEDKPVKFEQWIEEIRPTLQPPVGMQL